MRGGECDAGVAAIVPGILVHGYQVCGGEGGAGIVPGVLVHGCQVYGGEGGASAGPHAQPRVVDQLGQGVVDGADEDGEAGSHAGLVLVRPLHPCTL